MSHKIPKQIFQCFKKKELSNDFQQIVNTWKTNNPDYIYSFYDDNDCEVFISKFFEERIINAYRRILPGGFKADLWRYCILYVYGGIYVDLDTLCLGKIDDFLTSDTEFMTPIDLGGNHMLFNCFIASVPKSPILLNCIERIVRSVETNSIPESRMDFSGPGVLGKAVNKYLGRLELSPYLGMEGFHGNIHFLKFEEGTEYVRDSNNVLFQNKNGNRMIQMLYGLECQKAGIICWVNSPNILL